MRATPRRVPFLAIAALLLPALSSLPALEAAAPASCRPGDVFENDDVSVLFHGVKGFVKVFDAGGSDGEDGDGEGRARDAYRTGAIVETDAAGNATRAHGAGARFPADERVRGRGGGRVGQHDARSHGRR